MRCMIILYRVNEHYVGKGYLILLFLIVCIISYSNYFVLPNIISK